MAYDNLDFLNLNSLRNFPLKEGVSRLDNSGAFTLPNDFIVDLQIAVATEPTKRFYLYKLANLVDYVGVEIYDDTNVHVGSFTFAVATHNQNQSYYLTPTTEYVGSTGVLTVGTIATLQELPSGTYYFTLANAELEMRTVVPGIKGINRFIFKNASGETFALSGDVVIEARTNLQFKLGDDDQIILDAGDGLGLNTDCAPERICVKTINGIPPDEEGNFTLDFSACALLTPIPANTGLLLEDTCCKPCVGCSDIEELTERLMQAESTLIQLRDYYNSLDLLYQQFKTTSTYSCDCPPSS